MLSLVILMTALLGPELAIDGAAVEQDVMRSDIDGFALVQHKDQIAIDQ